MQLVPSRRISRTLIPMVLLGLSFPLRCETANAQENWPQFRGPDAQGTSDAKGLPDRWSTEENVVWKVEIPGRGWSSPVVWGKRIFLTTAVKKEGELEKVKPGLYFGGDRKTPTEPHQWIVQCRDFDTGKLVWEKVAHEGTPNQGHHLKNTLASETPVVDGERVYAYFGNVGLFCYDLEGKELWKADLGAFRTAFNWGTAASPVLHDGRLYVVHDNEQESFLVALDARTGDEVWREKRDEKSNWATPFIWKNTARTELVVPGKKKVRSYDLEGNLLWELGGMSSIVVPTPLASHGLLFVSSGYVMDKKRPMFAIKPGASGDISLKEKETSNEFISWSIPQAGPYNPSPLINGETLFVLYDRGIFAAFDATTGKPLYEKERVRLPDGGYTASPWAYEGKVFCLSEDGNTAVIPATGEFEVLYSNSLDELCMATPAIAKGSLFIRTESKLYRIASQ